MPTAEPEQPLGQELPDLHYDLYVMTKMLGVLPEGIARPLLAQHQKISNDILQLLAALVARDQIIAETVGSAKLEHTYVTFDLEATRRERDRLRQQLEGQGHDESS
jgi:hypothetical protein